MAAAVEPRGRIITFKESPQSAWGILARAGSSRARGRTASLPDALPRAQKNPAEAIGSISLLNAYIGKEGLHRRRTLPPVIFDLYSSPPLRSPPPPPPPQPLQLPATTVAGAAGDLAAHQAEAEGGGAEVATEMAHVMRKGKRPIKRNATQQQHKQHQQQHQQQWKQQQQQQQQQQQKQQEQQHPPHKVSIKIPEESDYSGSADTQLIELAVYPGFSPHSPTPLPHNLKTMEQMKRVIRAQTKLSTKLESYRQSWSRLFYSPPSQAIFLDYYWWFFLHKYQTNQHSIQDKLFARIAKNYVKMIVEPVDIGVKDSFFKMYADMIGQCVYTSVMFAYPNSWISFDEDFKTEVCNYITLWQEGTKPVPNSWIKWELRLLEPVDLPKCKTDEEEQVGVKSAGSFDFDTLLRNARRKAFWTSPSHVNNNSVLESSFETKLSIGEVKEALSSRGGGGGGGGGGRDGAGQCDEKERLGVAMEQLNALERSKATKLLTLHQTSPSNYGGSSVISEIPECSSKKVEEVSMSGGGGGGGGSSGGSKQQRAVCINEDTVMTEERPGVRAGAGLGAGSSSKHGTTTKCRSKSRTTTAAISSASTTSRIKSTLSPKSKSRECKSSVACSSSRGTTQRPASSSVRPQSATTTTSRRRGSGGGAGGAGGGAGSGGSSSQATSSRRCSMDSSNAPGAPLVPIPHGASKYDGKLKRMALSFKKQQQEGSATLKGPDFEHVVFNLFGHSPLVKHYIDNMSLSHVSEKEIVVGRTEIVEEPPKDAVCYKDVLVQSKIATDSNREEFLRHYRQQKRAIISANRKRLEARKMHERNVQVMMLANQREVFQKQGKDQTKHDVKQAAYEGKEAASSAV